MFFLTIWIREQRSCTPCSMISGFTYIAPSTLEPQPFKVTKIEASTIEQELEDLGDVGYSRTFLTGLRQTVSILARRISSRMFLAALVTHNQQPTQSRRLTLSFDTITKKLRRCVRKLGGLR